MKKNCFGNRYFVIHSRVRITHWHLAFFAQKKSFCFSPIWLHWYFSYRPVDFGPRPTEELREINRGKKLTLTWFVCFFAFTESKHNPRNRRGLDCSPGMPGCCRERYVNWAVVAHLINLPHPTCIIVACFLSEFYAVYSSTLRRSAGTIGLSSQST